MKMFWGCIFRMDWFWRKTSWTRFWGIHNKLPEMQTLEFRLFRICIGRIGDLFPGISRTHRYTLHLLWFGNCTTAHQVYCICKFHVKWVKLIALHSNWTTLEKTLSNLMRRKTQKKLGCFFEADYYVMCSSVLLWADDRKHIPRSVDNAPRKPVVCFILYSVLYCIIIRCIIHCIIILHTVTTCRHLRYHQCCVLYNNSTYCHDMSSSEIPLLNDGPITLLDWDRYFKRLTSGTLNQIDMDFKSDLYGLF